MFYWRLCDELDGFQINDQAGFEAGIRIEDALGTAESLFSACFEYDMVLWIASLDLRKAFDRLEYFAIFDSLRAQAITSPEIALLLDLYSDQRGCVNESRDFEIRRGAKQGDSLSALLFNAALGEVFRKWKCRIGNAGWRIRADYERLTNT